MKFLAIAALGLALVTGILLALGCGGARPPDLEERLTATPLATVSPEMEQLAEEIIGTAVAEGRLVPAGATPLPTATRLPVLPSAAEPRTIRATLTGIGCQGEDGDSWEATLTRLGPGAFSVEVDCPDCAPFHSYLWSDLGLDPVSGYDGGCKIIIVRE